MEASVRTLTLFGPPAAREMAKLLLENQPQIRRIDASSDVGVLRLFLCAQLEENSLIPLLAQSGISGFRLS